jgi:transposase
MSQNSGTPKISSGRIVKDIRRATRKQSSAEEKIRIVLDGLRGEHSIAELCRREGIAGSLYYTWPKEFLEAGNGAWRATRRARRPAARSRSCAGKPAR